MCRIFLFFVLALAEFSFAVDIAETEDESKAFLVDGDEVLEPHEELEEIEPIRCGAMSYSCDSIEYIVPEESGGNLFGAIAASVTVTGTVTYFVGRSRGENVCDRKKASTLRVIGAAVSIIGVIGFVYSFWF